MVTDSDVRSDIHDPTPFGSTVVYNPPGATAPLGERELCVVVGTFEREDGWWAWVATITNSEHTPDVSCEYVGDLLVVSCA